MTRKRDDVAALRTALATEDVLADVRAERQRQVQGEGFSTERDDAYARGELARAAAAYAVHASYTDRMRRERTERWARDGYPNGQPPATWPAGWTPRWWKPSTRRRDLVKAAALIVAEIERLDRAETLKGK